MRETAALSPVILNSQFSILNSVRVPSSPELLSYAFESCSGLRFNQGERRAGHSASARNHNRITLATGMTAAIPSHGE